MENDYTISKYDRLYANMHDVALLTKPSTIKNVQKITGRADTYVVQTARHEDGDYVFIEFIDESSAVVRLVLPPKVAASIASQRDSLTKRRRSISSRASMKLRIANGEVLGFQKKKRSA
jgi:hypothetical protein